jgi:hypothetical protein
VLPELSTLNDKLKQLLRNLVPDFNPHSERGAQPVPTKDGESRAMSILRA